MANRTTRTTARPSRPNPKADSGQPTPFLRRRSTRIVGALVALSLIGTIAGFWYLSRGARVVTTDQAVDAFRSDGDARPAAPDAPASSAPDAPAAAPNAQPNAPAAQPQQQPQQAAAATGYAPTKEGVYTFATRGYEETDALSGQRHDYPSETPFTIRKGGCGWIGRWQPLNERWDETEMCEKPEGTSMGRYTMYHEFFQRGVTENFACPGSFVQKPAAKPGDTWTFTCKSDSSNVAAKVSVVGVEDMNVGGRVVRAMRYRYDIKVSGANNGTLIQERWLANSPRVMVRMTQKADLKVATPFGGNANYREEFRIDLKSADPRT